MADAVNGNASGKPPARRGMFILPSLFTAGNIAVGYFVILQSFKAVLTHQQEYFDNAAIGLIFAMFFDALDGRIARMTNTASAFGKELDSLADVITFGVAPSLLAYLWGVSQISFAEHPELATRVVRIGATVCFLFLICGACRLARFNITTNAVPRNPGRADRKYFVGMPIPAAGCILGAVIHFESGSPVYSVWMSMLWLALVAFTGFLMVSTWRFWSGKEIDLSKTKPGRSLVILVLLGGIVAEFHRYALIALGLGYLMSGVLARIAYSWEERLRRQAA